MESPRWCGQLPLKCVNLSKKSVALGVLPGSLSAEAGVALLFGGDSCIRLCKDYRKFLLSTKELALTIGVARQHGVPLWADELQEAQESKRVVCVLGDVHSALTEATLLDAFVVPMQMQLFCRAPPTPSVTVGALPEELFLEVAKYSKCFGGLYSAYLAAVKSLQNSARIQKRGSDEVQMIATKIPRTRDPAVMDPLSCGIHSGQVCLQKWEMCLSKATSDVRISAFGLSHAPILAEIDAAFRRGLKVRLLLDFTHMMETAPRYVEELLKYHSAAVRFISKPQANHQKILLVDADPSPEVRAKMVTGSGNPTPWTLHALEYVEEKRSEWCPRDAAAICQVRLEFDRIWEAQEEVRESA
jgi:hypothetical protein